MPQEDGRFCAHRKLYLFYFLFLHAFHLLGDIAYMAPIRESQTLSSLLKKKCAHPQSNIAKEEKSSQTQNLPHGVPKPQETPATPSDHPARVVSAKSPWQGSILDATLIYG